MSIRLATARSASSPLAEGLLTTRKDRRGRLDRKPPRQRAETTKHALFVRAKQLIAPGDRRIDRLLAFGEIPRADSREQDIVRESAKQILGGQHFDPRGRKLERERQGIEPSTNRRHGGAVRGREAKVRLHVPHTLHEESHGGRARQIGMRHRIHLQRKRPDGVLPLSSHTERGAAGDQHSELGDRREEIRDQRRRVQHLLEIVEHQQRGAYRRTRAARASASRAPWRPTTPRASAIACATNAASRTAANPTNSTRDVPSCRDGSRDLQRQASLPDSSWSRERDEACVGIGEPQAQRLHVGIATEQGP